MAEIDLRKEFPGAKILASTLDAFAEEMEKAKECLPVVESEMGDTWSHGPPSDPLKVSMFRTLTRVRRLCLDEGRCSLDDHRFYNFSRLLLKNAEHDWYVARNLTCVALECMRSYASSTVLTLTGDGGEIT